MASSTWAKARIRFRISASRSDPARVARPASRRSRVQERPERMMSDNSTPDSAMKVARSCSPPDRSSLTTCGQRFPTWLRMFSSTRCWDCWSITIWQPEGKNGNPRSMSRSKPRRLAPVRARRRRSNRNSFRWCPTKSSTVNTALSRVRRSPRPSCCKNRVALSVGLRKSKVSTSGRSRPSLNRSAANKTFSRRARRSWSARARPWAGVDPLTASAAMPASRKTWAMNSAWVMLTQNPRARIAPRSSTRSRN